MLVNLNGNSSLINYDIRYYDHVLPGRYVIVRLKALTGI